jgi:hypothetical protein
MAWNSPEGPLTEISFHAPADLPSELSVFRFSFDELEVPEFKIINKASQVITISHGKQSVLLDLPRRGVKTALQDAEVLFTLLGFPNSQPND